MPGAAGEALFARYAYPPNELGHCGPPGSDAIFEAGAGGGGDVVRARARAFDGAWAYLRLLAATAGVPDPLDAEVVAAYWLGGELAARVPPGATTGLVGSEFAAQPGVSARMPAMPALAASGPTHAFHVFVIYPWVGLLGRGGSGGDVPRTMLDRCRVRWGTVQSVDGDRAQVLVRPLTWDGAALGLGEPDGLTCRWARAGEEFVRGLAPGDLVSVHWDWICDRLIPAAAEGLQRQTLAQLSAVNAWLSCRP